MRNDAWAIIRPRQIVPQGDGSGLDADKIRGLTPAEIVANIEEGGIVSLPPVGEKRITNFYYKPLTGELVIEAED